MARRMNIAARQTIFEELVKEQDRLGDVGESYRQLTEKHGLSVEELRKIVEEGLHRDWPLPELSA